MEVLEAMKGVTVEETTITYIEHGGEIDNTIYIYEGLNLVAIGEEYILQYIAVITEELAE